MGEVEFKDFLWEALLDPVRNQTMGGTAEKLAKQYGITRGEVDQFAAESFARAIAAQKSCFLSGEITPLASEVFELPGYSPRGIRLPRGVDKLSRGYSHPALVVGSSVQAQARISAECRPAATARESWTVPRRRWWLPANT